MKLDVARNAMSYYSGYNYAWITIIIIVAIVVLIPCAIRAYRRKRYGLPMWGQYGDAYGDNYYATRASPQQGYYGNEQPQFAIPVGQPIPPQQQAAMYQQRSAPQASAYQFPQHQGYRLGTQPGQGDAAYGKTPGENPTYAATQQTTPTSAGRTTDTAAAAGAGTNAHQQQDNYPAPPPYNESADRAAQPVGGYEKSKY